MTDADPRAEAARLIATQRWCALGTVDAHGAPSVTYVPFAPVDGAIGIVVSALASHAAHLAASPAASVLLVGDDVADPYARTRLTIPARAAEAAASSHEAEAVWDALAARHGETVAILRTLPDFRAVRLVPAGGRLVLGFASAHGLRGETLAELLRAR